MLRILFIGIITISALRVNAQSEINDFKYVVVPDNYTFFKGKDVYQINSLTKFLFNKYGFEAYMNGDDYPEDLKINGCKALQADVKRKSGVFVTKLTVELKDCNGRIVFTSSEGRSREKEFKPAYHEALREAFKDVEGLHYNYNGNKEKSVRIKGQQEEGVVSEEMQAVALSSSIESTISYLFNNTIFVFKKQEYGFEIFKHEEKEMLVGKAFKSKISKSYIVQAGDLSGNGYFDAYSNFILERINPVTNKIVTDTFARQ
ncbi:hypothetical protein [Aquimarina muelleri]|nr:hypothetical protein [Aquimarina muelleri]MCX2762156.1 hypothetical protein [Aquimarina muelleri]